MTPSQEKFLSCAALAIELGALKSLVLSKPKDSINIKKIKFTLRESSGNILLVREDYLSDGKAIQKPMDTAAFAQNSAELLPLFEQANLLTSNGDGELRITKKGAEVLLGVDKLEKRLTATPGAQNEIKPLHRSKNYILNGNEDFLSELGITDKNGRIHDKMQPKFRQINRFLEYISDITDKLPKDKIVIYDLCCGKSYLSFAVYHYFENILGRDIEMLGVDLKADVIDYCNGTAERCGFDKLRFICGDIKKVEYTTAPDLVISLHACDIATDIVLDTAAELGAKVILSTPCCQHELYSKLDCPELDFIADYPVLKNKLCAVATDAMRLKKLESQGYNVKATELTDPDDTPKNVLLVAIKRDNFSPASTEALRLRAEYSKVKKFLLGE